MSMLSLPFSLSLFSFWGVSHFFLSLPSLLLFRPKLLPEEEKTWLRARTLFPVCQVQNTTERKKGKKEKNTNFKTEP